MPMPNTKQIQTNFVRTSALHFLRSPDELRTCRIGSREAKAKSIPSTTKVVCPELFFDFYCLLLYFSQFCCGLFVAFVCIRVSTSNRRLQLLPEYSHDRFTCTERKGDALR
jgi:hypothetical protein